MELGLQPDRSLEVPPLSRAETAGWYRFSPSPGQVGPAVIVGHVDSRTGPAVFYRLSSLRPGDLVQVRRADGVVAEFAVDHIESFAKSAFPTQAVYGQIEQAGLRLITCSGEYRAAEGGYQENTVVFASLRRMLPSPGGAAANPVAALEYLTNSTEHRTEMEKP